MTGERSQHVDRRTVLGGIAAGATSALAGCSLFETGDDGETSVVEDADRARSLAEQFAPTLYFDEHEQWFPTDPQPYAVERDGETVVDGFEALNGYAERSGDDGDPVDPVSFFNVVEYDESPLAVVQFWFYSAFDQFATDFHWHDWEVLHVFVDTETGEPQLYVASSHSRKVPNNEFPDPDGEYELRPTTDLEHVADFVGPQLSFEFAVPDFAEDAVAAVEEDGDSDDTDDDQSSGGGGGRENAVNGLVNALEAVAEAAQRAAQRAEAGDRGNADKQLAAVQNRLERVSSRLAAARDSLPPGLANAADNRLEQSRRRSEQARNADKL
jgi:hypothetical protein